MKEKEQARREYKEAIEKGKGAYLMEEDEPDIFTVSVGNLPVGTRLAQSLLSGSLSRSLSLSLASSLYLSLCLSISLSPTHSLSFRLN